MNRQIEKEKPKTEHEDQKIQISNNNKISF
jgi:hypothetical protein